MIRGVDNIRVGDDDAWVERKSGYGGPGKSQALPSALVHRGEPQLVLLQDYFHQCDGR